MAFRVQCVYYKEPVSDVLTSIGEDEAARLRAHLHACHPQAEEQRIHVLAEAFFPATLVYLALVFPRDRGALTTCVAAGAWSLSLALAIPYELLLAQPGAYSVLHAACETYLGVAGLALVGSLLLERSRAGDAASPVLRAALASALLGSACRHRHAALRAHGRRAAGERHHGDCLPLSDLLRLGHPAPPSADQRVAALGELLNHFRLTR